MPLTPTWDLIYIALGTTVMVYSCIIGRDWTAKIILATYAAILATDAFGILFESLLMNETYIDLARGFTDRGNFLASWKLTFFAIFLIVFARKAGYSLQLGDPESYTIRVGSRLIYGIMSAVLITTALLVYTTGSSFIFGSFGPGVAEQVATNAVYQNTDLVRLVYENARWVFLVPASVLLFRIK